MQILLAFVLLFLCHLGLTIGFYYITDEVPNLFQQLALYVVAITLIFAVSCQGHCKSKTLKIAIIDTGYDDAKVIGPKLKLCKYGSVDFSELGGGYDKTHGTTVASILAQELKDVDYCAIVYTVNIYNNAEQISTALYKASYEGVVAINASYTARYISIAEREAFKDATKRVPAIFVAAGNDHLNLDQECLSFPTCFDIPHVISVGALTPKGLRAPHSNYGSKVKLWFNGNAFNGWFGTSFAAPRALASYVRELAAKQQ